MDSTVVDINYSQVLNLAIDKIERRTSFEGLPNQILFQKLIHLLLATLK